MNPDKESSDNPTVEELTKEIQSLRAENERLRRALEEALRSLKRQAAPFSKGKPKSDPKRPGRKKGLDYGPRAFRAVPDHVDEEIPVPLPKKCPDCGGRVIHDDTQPQYQEDIIRRTMALRCGDGSLRRMRWTCSRPTPLANVRCSGSGTRPSGSAGIDAGCPYEQRDGDLS